jgi:hypothetical protein
MPMIGPPRRHLKRNAEGGAEGVRLKKVAQLSEFVILSRLQAAKNLPWRFPQRDSSLRSE